MINLILKLRRYRWYILGRRKIKKKIRQAAATREIKIIIGNGGTLYSDWIATDIPHFDITKESDWNYFFSNHKIDKLLAEHVLEHLQEQDVEAILKYASVFLKRSGTFRIAVPDAYHPSEKYIALTKPPYHGHKSFWNYAALKRIAEKNNFTVRFLEYYDENKIFHQNPYSNDDGYIARSKLNNFSWDMVPGYTSLIIDLIK